MGKHQDHQVGQRQIPERWNQITKRVIAAAIEVHSWLGPGQLEHMYEEGMAVELGLMGLAFVRQKPIRMIYKGVEIGDLRVDLAVENLIIVELKAIERVAPVHLAQLTSYLRSTDHPLGLLINFNNLRLVEGVSRRINPQSALVRELPLLNSASSASSEFDFEDGQ